MSAEAEEMVTDAVASNEGLASSAADSAQEHVVSVVSEEIQVVSDSDQDPVVSVDVVQKPVKAARVVKNKPKKKPQAKVIAKGRVNSDSALDDGYAGDEFDFNHPINIATDVCAFCKEGHEFGLLLKTMIPQLATMDVRVSDDGDEVAVIKPAFQDPHEVWISKYALIMGNRRAFVHFYCALTSPRVWYTGEEWKNVAKEIRRSATLSCSDCKKKGATIGCYSEKCKVSVHLPCALNQGYRYLRYNITFMCPEHKAQQDPKLPQVVPKEISRGLENIPIQFVNTIDEREPLQPQTEFSGLSDGFHYIKQNLDSDTASTHVRNLDGMDYCTCSDLCDDVTRCECIHSGRNYTHQGLLIPDNGSGEERRVLECNFKCACSYRRCTNRVVERGLNVRLQVVRTKDEVRSSSDWSLPTGRGTKQRSGWGVKTLDFIPRYAFVCEVMGQFHRVTDRVAKDDEWAMSYRKVRVSRWDSEQSIAQTGLSAMQIETNGSSTASAGSLTASAAAPITQTTEPEVIDLAESDQDEALRASMIALDRMPEVPADVSPATIEDELCLDCNMFGNVGAFLRRSRTQQTTPMFIRRLVYNSSRHDATPRLALFAAYNIEADTELLL